MLLVDENKEMKSAKISLWSRSGPGLLLAAFAVFLFKTAPFYWPLTLTSFLGYAFIRLWKKKGLIFSLIGLCFVFTLSLRSHHEHFWISTLSLSIALAWLLIYLGGQDAEAFMEKREEALEALMQQKQELEKQVRDIKTSLSAEKHKSNLQASESLHALTKAAQLKEIFYKEKQTLLDKCNVLSKNVSFHLSNESNLQQALNRAEAQITELRKQLLEQAKKHEEALFKTQVNIESSFSEEEQLQTRQLQSQLSLLREQFDEKSDALDQTRRELFATENALLTLQKACEESRYEMSEEVMHYSRDLKSLESTYIEMENQVLVLQDIISVLLTTKTRTAASTKTRASQKKLPRLF